MQTPWKQIKRLQAMAPCGTPYCERCTPWRLTAAALAIGTETRAEIVEEYREFWSASDLRCVLEHLAQTGIAHRFDDGCYTLTPEAVP